MTSPNDVIAQLEKRIDFQTRCGAPDPLLTDLAALIQGITVGRSALIASVGEHITVRSEYLARAEAAEAALTQAVETEREECAEFIWAGDWEQPNMPDHLSDKPAVYVWGYAQSQTLADLIDAIRARSTQDKT